MEYTGESDAKRAKLSGEIATASAGPAPETTELASDGNIFTTSAKNEALLAPVINDLTSSNIVGSKEAAVTPTPANPANPEASNIAPIQNIGAAKDSNIPVNGQNVGVSASFTDLQNSSNNTSENSTNFSGSVGLSTEKLQANSPNFQNQQTPTQTSAPGSRISSTSSIPVNANTQVSSASLGEVQAAENGQSSPVRSIPPAETNNSIAVEPKKPVERRLVITTAKLNIFGDFVNDFKKDPGVALTEVAFDNVATMDKEAFDFVHLCLTLDDECEETLARMKDFLLTDNTVLTLAAKIGVHVDFHRCKHWAEVSEQIKTAYAQTLDAAAQKWDSKVKQCSFVNKYDFTDNFLDEDLAPMNADIRSELSRWHNLEILDYSENCIRLVSGINFPDSIRILNLGGGFALESLAGFKMPPKLEGLELSENSISSTDYVVYPSTLKTLNLSENRIYFLNNVEFPASLEHLDVSGNRIDTLKNVVFPRNLKYLSISMNPIECIKGVRFPESIDHLDLSCIPNESMTGIKFPDNTKSLNLQSSMTNTRGLKLPPFVENLNMASNGVNSINPLKLPNSIQNLYLSHNNIKTLNKVAFPTSIRELYLGNNMITTLKNVQFPPTLEVLDLEMDPYHDENEKFITSLKDVYFPASLRVLRLGHHSIKTIEAVDFPFGLEELSLEYNDLRVFRNVKFGPRLHTLDLSGNQELVSLDNVYFPESLREIRVPSVLVDTLPSVLVERANKQQLKITKSLPYTI